MSDLRPPLRPFTTSSAESTTSSRGTGVGPLLSDSDREKIAVSGSAPGATRNQRALRRKRLFFIGGALALVVILAVAIPVGITQSNKSSGSSSASAPQQTGGESTSQVAGSTATRASSSATPSATPTAIIAGKAGSLVRLTNGTEVPYVNTFGGDWAFDPADPSGSKMGGGKAQSWSPRVGGNDSWVWGRDIVRGVNLGGWLVTEPFICPGIYEKWLNKTGSDIIDEWTLTIAMGDQAEAEMTEHYETFITEQDFMDIAAAGLNWVRIPIGFWAIETIGNEPFVPKVSWTYFLKALGWARKYGLRVNMDLHALPGSQNSWNHSGKQGSVNFLASSMGMANAERGASYIRMLAEFASRPEYRDVVPIFGIVNEVLSADIGTNVLQSFYLNITSEIRADNGVGAGKGPYIAVHEGFTGLQTYDNFIPNADRVIVDQHPYIAFQTGTYGNPIESFLTTPCSWASAVNVTSRTSGVNIGGEFSGAINDCGLWLNSIGPGGSSTSGTSAQICAATDDWRQWSAARKASQKQIIMASMDALQNYFFWTWKIGVSTTLGYSSSSPWHYQLGWQQGWVPKDPREATGICAVSGEAFNGQYPPHATGGAGAGDIPASASASMPWPPASLLNVNAAATRLPQYVPTGTIVPLAGETITSGSETITIGVATATAQTIFVPVAGCSYPDAWGAGNAVPTNACGAGVAAPTAAATVTTTAASSAAVTVTPTSSSAVAAVTTTASSAAAAVTTTASSVDRKKRMPLQ